ncbi:hypothetical protein [Caldilinea sp.]|uniref:hypothetical protein n=1 Tax=Caldilinea sp. TaxID=2293560 RepID=UPI002B73400E|nr:hypothetical protein [Anaerolineales bacterium]HQY92323.1 hypothetical protein [Caldilinea sp.]HRA66444.1 hypothetical protein [Caldilinea sp.]
MQPSTQSMTPDRPRWAPLALTALGFAGLAAALWLIPPEQTLGNVIKVIFLHGALVRVALLVFGAAGVLSLGFLLSRRVALFAWAMATQKGAVTLWILYVLTSIISTRLSWGEWIAWEEPRVRASIHVLWFSIACLLLVLWMGNRYVAAAVNVLVTGVTWALIRGATIIRHPFDPIGSSGSDAYQTLYWVMVAALMVLAFMLVRWLHKMETQNLAG